MIDIQKVNIELVKIINEQDLDGCIFFFSDGSEKFDCIVLNKFQDKNQMYSVIADKMLKAVAKPTYVQKEEMIILIKKDEEEEKQWNKN